MKKVLRKAKPVSILLSALMLLMLIPCQPLFAAMIDTETLLEQSRGREARNSVNRILAQKEVRSLLIKQGIDPSEARARVDSLSDAEVIRLAEQIEQLPAGGSDFGLIIGASLFVFIVLLITDILGYTNVFPFVS